MEQLGIIAFVFLIYFFIGWFLGVWIDRDEDQYALEAQEHLGCGCVAPLFITFNSVFGCGSMLILYILGFLGPWYTVVIPAVIPVTVSFVFFIFVNREE